MAMAIVITACAFFFIPTTLIILGYYSSQPTGTLISPVPQGVLSQQPTPPAPTAASGIPTAKQTQPQAEQPLAEATPVVQEPDNQPIIATDNTATEAAATEVAPVSGSNITDKVATIQANSTETLVSDPDVTELTQIYLSPRPNDKAIYSLRSKKAGEFVIAVGEASSSSRYIDYHLVNP